MAIVALRRFGRAKGGTAPAGVRAWTAVAGGAGSLVLEGTRMAGAGSSKVREPSVATDGLRMREVFMMLPYCGRSTGVDVRLRRSPSSPSSSFLLNLASSCSGILELAVLDRPSGAGLVPLLLLLACLLMEKGLPAEKRCGVCRGGRSPERRRTGVALARLMARETALMCFLPAL